MRAWLPEMYIMVEEETIELTMNFTQYLNVLPSCTTAGYVVVNPRTQHNFTLAQIANGGLAVLCVIVKNITFDGATSSGNTLCV